MYIPTWLIIAVVIFGIYYFSKSKKQHPSENNMPQIFKQKFSYKLDVTIEPDWTALYKKIIKPESEKEWEKLVKEREKVEEEWREFNKDNGEGIFGRRYNFTEYYDSASGLTTRFQKVIYQNGEQCFTPVDEFGNRGYLFGSDSGFHAFVHAFDKDETDEKREARKKLTVEIGEDFIRNDIFDKHIGGPRLDYEEENYLFQFPLFDVFNFLFALGHRFHGTEGNTIIKWPDQIEKKFKELGIEYETYFDYDPEPFDIEKHDKEFFEKWGKPKICLYSGDRFDSGYLVTKDKTYYGVQLKMFRPGENDRIGWES